MRIQSNRKPQSTRAHLYINKTHMNNQKMLNVNKRSNIKSQRERTARVHPVKRNAHTLSQKHAQTHTLSLSLSFALSVSCPLFVGRSVHFFVSIFVPVYLRVHLYWRHSVSSVPVPEQNQLHLAKGGTNFMLLGQAPRYRGPFDRTRTRLYEYIYIYIYKHICINMYAYKYINIHI